LANYENVPVVSKTEPLRFNFHVWVEFEVTHKHTYLSTKHIRVPLVCFRVSCLPIKSNSY